MTFRVRREITYVTVTLDEDSIGWWVLCRRCGEYKQWKLGPVPELRIRYAMRDCSGLAPPPRLHTAA